jgi:uncharacterized protein YlxW (UPF0749 family)
MLLAGSMAFAVTRQDAAATTGAAHATSQPMTSEQVQSLREDLTRMKALVQQMETNLSFVDTSQTPLKHQFQLEIDMWRMMIRQMEHRLGQGNTK